MCGIKTTFMITQGCVEFSMDKKFLSLEKFYTNIVSGVSDYYEVCHYVFIKYSVDILYIFLCRCSAEEDLHLCKSFCFRIVFVHFGLLTPLLWHKVDAGAALLSRLRRKCKLMLGPLDSVVNQDDSHWKII